MTEKEKIIEIISDVIWRYEPLLKYEPTPAPPEIPTVPEAIADALVAAGLRFTFTSEFASDTQKAYKEGYLKGKEESKAEIALAKAFHDEKCAEYELVCYKLQKA